MSMPSIFHQLKQTKSGLLDKICSNQDLASLIVGLLTRIVYICEFEKALPVTGMTFDPWNSDGGVFRAKVHFNRIALARTHKWGPRREFAEYAAQKAGKLALALRDNPDMEGWFQSLVEAIDSWSGNRGYDFKNLEFVNHIITRDDVVVLTVKNRSQLTHV